MSTHSARRSIAVALFAVAVAVVGALAATAAAQTNGTPEKYNATAVNMGTGPTGMGRVLVSVERWSTAADREKLAAELTAKGPEKLLDALRKNPKVGYIRLPNTLAWDLHYAYESPLPDGGRRVVLATDRPISLEEARNQPRRADYPFTLLEIRFDKDGVGVGKMSVYTKVTLSKDKQTLELENYGTEPVRLSEVRIEK